MRASRRRLDRSFVRVAIGRFPPQHINAARAANHVDAFALRVEENVICVATYRQPGDVLSRIGVVNQQDGRGARADEEAPALFVERHRKIRFRARNRPSGQHFAFRPIDNCDLPRSGDVHECPLSACVELEGLGMARQWYVSGRLAAICMQ